MCRIPSHYEAKNGFEQLSLLLLPSAGKHVMQMPQD